MILSHTNFTEETFAVLAIIAILLGPLSSSSTLQILHSIFFQSVIVSESLFESSMLSSGQPARIKLIFFARLMEGLSKPIP